MTRNHPSLLTWKPSERHRWARKWASLQASMASWGTPSIARAPRGDEAEEGMEGEEEEDNDETAPATELAGAGPNDGTDGT